MGRTEGIACCVRGGIWDGPHPSGPRVNPAPPTRALPAPRAPPCGHVGRVTSIGAMALQMRQESHFAFTQSGENSASWSHAAKRRAASQIFSVRQPQKLDYPNRTSRFLHDADAISASFVLNGALLPAKKLLPKHYLAPQFKGHVWRKKGRFEREFIHRAPHGLRKRAPANDPDHDQLASLTDRDPENYI